MPCRLACFLCLLAFRQAVSELYAQSKYIEDVVMQHFWKNTYVLTGPSQKALLFTHHVVRFKSKQIWFLTTYEKHVKWLVFIIDHRFTFHCNIVFLLLSCKPSYRPILVLVFQPFLIIDLSRLYFGDFKRGFFSSQGKTLLAKPFFQRFWAILLP